MSIVVLMVGVMFPISYSADLKFFVRAEDLVLKDIDANTRTDASRTK
jgi:hypothetical protein